MGIAQRQGNADRRWVAMTRTSQLDDSLVRLVQESFMAVPRWVCFLRGKRAPSSSRGLVVYSTVCMIGYRVAQPVLG